MDVPFVNLKYFSIKDCYFDPVSMSVGHYGQTQILLGSCQARRGYSHRKCFRTTKSMVFSKFPLGSSNTNKMGILLARKGCIPDPQIMNRQTSETG